MIYLISLSSPSYTDADIQVEPPKTVQELVLQYSKEYDVSSAQMMRIIKCENYRLDPTAQSELKYKKGNRWKLPAGSREQSYGLVQIHAPDHPEITYEQATDANFSIEYLAKNLKQGHGKMWSCFSKIYG